MIRNALVKDVFRTIKKEKKRFFSILLITALGVTMMTGLTAACNDLRVSADALYDGQNLFDIEVSSTLGLDDDDIEALKSLDEVTAVEGEYSKTVYVEVDGVHESATIRTLGDEINLPTVLEGTLPQTEDEIAVTESYLTDSGKQIGDTLTFEEMDLEEEEDAVFADVEYTITAEVLDPFDVNNREGSVSFRASTSDEYAFFVLPAAADSDIYTSVYLTVAGADELMCYSDAYIDLIDDVKNKISSTLKETQQQNRYDTVYGEALAEYNDALEEVLTELEDARQEIDDGWEEYQDGLDQLNDGKAELEQQEESAYSQIADALAQIESGYDDLAEAKEQLDASAKELADGAAQLSEAREELEQTKEETYSQIDAGIAQYEEAIAQAEIRREALVAQETELTEQKEALEVQKEALEAQEEELTAQQEALTEQKTSLETQVAQLQAALTKSAADGESAAPANEDPETETLQTQLVQAQEALTELESGLTEVESGITQLEEALAQLQAGLDTLDAGLAEAQSGLEVLQA